MLKTLELCTPSKDAQGRPNAGDDFQPHDPNMLRGQQVRGGTSLGQQSRPR
jgi:hypothetical protein